MLNKICTGKMNDECYSLLWKAPDGVYQITGVQDNERDRFYRIFHNQGELLDFIRDLNIKEEFRSKHYKDICESFEKTIRQAEDRWLEQIQKTQELEDENQKLKEKIKNLSTKNIKMV